MNLGEIIRKEAIIPELKSVDKISVLAELVQPLTEINPELDQEEVIKVLLERERLGSTGIGEGIAIPHGKTDQVNELMISFGRSINGVEFESIDGQPANFFFLLLAPEKSTGEHLKALAKFSRVLKSPSFRDNILQAADRKQIHEMIVTQESKV